MFNIKNIQEEVCCLNLQERALLLHEQNKGKITVQSKVPVQNMEDLSLAYSPGVAEPCLQIKQDIENVYRYTSKGNLVAVVSNGTAVLGLGNIGPEAALPVMEGKAILFKEFADIDAVPLCINATDTDEIVKIIKSLEPTFGGVNLEDIAAPACFEIEERLKAVMNIPVFHDDQHGTAIVTVAALLNSLKLVSKSMENIRVVINGAGSAGIAITKLLLLFGVEDVILCDTKGAIYENRPVGMNAVKHEIAQVTNQTNRAGSLKDVIVDADVFIGVSAAGELTKEMIQTMNVDSIVFAMANPVPEIMPEEAIQAGVRVIGTGRSDYPNQINNVLAFPGIFRGALNVGARSINEEMKMAATYALANLVDEDELRSDYVLPNSFDKRVVSSVAEAVEKAAIKTGNVRNEVGVVGVGE